MADQANASSQQFTEAALAALLTTDQLLTAPAGAPGLVSPSEMYAYATDAGYQPSTGLLEALDNRPDIRASFHRLLDNTARYHLPQVAAASSGQIEQRESQGCKFSFRPSRADPSQMYVIIENTRDMDFAPKILFVCNRNGATSRTELPAAQNGRVQLLLERDSDMAKGLLDIKTEVYMT